MDNEEIKILNELLANRDEYIEELKETLFEQYKIVDEMASMLNIAFLNYPEFEDWYKQNILSNNIDEIKKIKDLNDLSFKIEEYFEKDVDKNDE